MLVIVDTNIVYEPGLFADRLSRAARRLLQACADKSHPVIVPATVQLEFQRHQQKHVDEECARLRTAYDTLDRYGVAHDGTDPKDLIAPPDLLTLMRQEGARVDVAEPSSEDLHEAHRRACLRVPPAQPESKSDEMRDLVIWTMALRLAEYSDGGLLISNDKVHNDHRSDDEALSSSLTRVDSIQRALEYLKVVTGPGRVLAELLEPVWRGLLDAGLPLPQTPVVMSASDVVLRQGAVGLSHATARVELQASEGRLLAANLTTKVHAGAVTELQLTDVTVGGEQLDPVTISHSAPEQPAFLDDYAERMDALRRVLGS